MIAVTHLTAKACIFALLVLLIMPGCQKPIEENRSDFVIHPDFKLELVASEPLVFDPIALQFDETGRAFVLEMPGYPKEDVQSRLILLEDLDGDGQYDHRQVFADNLHLASSFLPYKGGMLVAAPPDLLYIKDTDGDKVADDYQVIMTGFSTGNLQHNYNGLTYGLDNWIYAANGGNSGNPYFVEDTTAQLEMRDDDIRFRVEEKRLERVGASSGGFGLAFDQWGHMYETHNLEHVSHLVFENRYLADLPVTPQHALTVISDHEENGLSRIYPIGEQASRVNHPEQSGYFSGSCGITFYGGGAFSETFNDNLFVADVVLNLVHLDVLSPDRASFKTSRMREKVEFLASKDRAFRPVNMTTGPDGALYLIDIHRDVIEHPEWIPDEIEVDLDLDAGKEKGRIYRISAKDSDQAEFVKLDAANIPQLVNSLESPNQWVRMTAQRLLVGEGNAAAVPELEELYAKTENPLTRLHILWTLEGTGQLKDELLMQALTTQSAGLRENAVKIAEARLSVHPTIVPELIRLLADTNDRVVMQAALSLSTLSDSSFQKNVEAIHTALDQLLQTRENLDRWTIIAAAAALKRDAFPFCRSLLTKKGALNDNQKQLATILAEVIGQQNDGPAISAFLTQLKQNPNLSSQVQAVWIDAFASGWEWNKSPYNDPGVEAALGALEADGDIPTIRAAGKLRKAMMLPVSSKINAALTLAREGVVNRQLAADERLEFLQLIKLDNFEGRENLLYDLLDNQQPLTIQKEALWQLWESNQPHVGPKLLERWPALGPEARKGAGDILLYRPYHHDLLLSALENGRIKVGELNFDLERRRELLFSEDKKVRERAEKLFSDAGVVTRKEAVEKMRPALLLPGDLAKGKEVFATLCSSCHQYGEIGENVGPVLTEIQRKSKEALLYDILDPNAAVDTRYLNHRVRTKDGNIVLGIVEQETDTEVSLRMMGGQELRIPKKEIAEFSSVGLSLMPEGLEASMDEQGMADLLAFLQQEIY